MSKCIIMVTDDSFDINDETAEVLQNDFFEYIRRESIITYNEITVICSDINKVDNIINSIDTANLFNLRILPTQFNKFGGRARYVRNMEIFRFAKDFDNVIMYIIGKKPKDFWYLSKLFTDHKKPFSSYVYKHLEDIEF